MSDDRKYSRLYWSVIDDARFVGIFEDDHHWATYTRLLMIAEGVWPSSAHLPTTARRASVAALASAGILELGTAGRFRIHGLDAERNARGTAARNAAALRWHSERNADPMPRRDEHRQAETRRDETSNADQQPERADVEAFLLVARHHPSPKQQKLLDDLLDRHDLNGPEWAAGIIHANPDDPIGALLAADQTWRDERIAAAVKAERKPPQSKRRNGLPESARDILAHWKATEPTGAEPK